MSFSHEAIAAWPTPGDGDPDRALIRAMTTRRFAYCLAADEAASDFTAKDPVSGVPPLNLIQNGTLFAYDETDSTTTGDGVTCLVTNDACRYKSDTIAPPWSVLDKDLTAQPVSPSDGDRYLIPTAATGTDWAGNDGKIAIRKGLRWHFAVVPIGRFLYVEDETAFYHRTTSGVWTAGVGSIAISANSVDLTKVLGANASFVIKVENQTTNAPPASPVVPTAYVIGPSPTDAWAGNAGKLAICRVAGSFTIITPAAGDTVYDKALSKSVVYTGTAWDAANNALVLLSSQIASNSATIDIPLPQTDIYDAFEIRVSSLKPVTDGAEVRLRVGTGAGPTYQTTGYRWSNIASNTGTNTGTSSTNGESIRLTQDSTNGVGNAAGENFNAIVRFNNPEASDYMEIAAECTYSRSDGVVNRNFVGGRYDTPGAITALRFLMSGGNIAAGRFSLYALRKT